jgi:uncharacterized protein (TIGR02001 family)
MASDALAKLVRARLVAVTAIVVLWLESAISVSALAQARDDSAIGSIGLGSRRGLTEGAPVRTAPSPDGKESPFEFSFSTGFATDYIYRGTTLSARQPAVGSAVEVAFSQFYAGVAIARVKLPSEPVAEVTLNTGFRPKVGNIDFDFAWTYYHYPGERPPLGVVAGIDYWQIAGRADTKLGEVLRVAAGYAYSPNSSNTGAWGQYAAAGLGIDLPRALLPQNITASLTGGAGYSWFGTQKAELGGFPLPAYLNWQAGVTFTREKLNLDLRYYDTNLSKENCFVLTGDPNASPGGSIDPVRNPEGLTSRWCSATFVAKFWFALN